MDVSAQFHGILADWVGMQKDGFVLPEGACLSDLMSEIGHRFRHQMPDYLWDEEKDAFKESILAVGRKGIPLSPETPLSDGEEIRFFLMMSGG